MVEFFLGVAAGVFLFSLGIFVAAVWSARRDVEYPEPLGFTTEQLEALGDDSYGGSE